MSKPKNTTVSIGTVSIIIKGKQHDLTLDEVKQLKAELERAFPDQKAPAWTPPVIIRDSYRPRTYDIPPIWCGQRFQRITSLSHATTASDCMRAIDHRH